MELLPPKPPTPDVPILSIGEFVYFKQCKKDVKPKTRQIQFQGHGMGVFLGHVPNFQPTPPMLYVMGKFGQMGFILFDDVMEFIGEDLAKECIKKWEAKYNPMPGKPVQPVAEVSPIVDTTGQPLE